MEFRRDVGGSERGSGLSSIGRSVSINLARLTYTPPASGRLELATPVDRGMLLPWLQEFARETAFESQNLADILASLIVNQQLYLWKNPGPVSMAAWVSPTPNGGCINLVYTPTPFRGKGHGTAVVAALGRQMLSDGRRFCFIIADPSKHELHSMYQRVGARTLCELLRVHDRAGGPGQSRLAAAARPGAR